jgi:hypothetical protein
MVVASACLTFAAHAAAGPLLKIDKAKLKAAFHCTGEVANASREPIMLSTGTLSSGTGLHGGLKGALDAYRHPVCYVDYPHLTTADIQNSVQYLVYGIRKMAHIAGRPGAVYGISQGALLPRVALTYWPRLRRKVTDVVAGGGNPARHDGSQLPVLKRQPMPARDLAAGGRFQLPEGAKPPARRESRQGFLDHGANARRRASAAADRKAPDLGAEWCRQPRDSIGLSRSPHQPHRSGVRLGEFRRPRRRSGSQGPRPGIVPAGRVCSHEYAPGLDEQLIDAVLGALPGELAEQLALVPKVNHEPRVRGWLKRGP